MANVILANPDYTQASAAFAVVALSGGSWSTALPLSNLLRPEFAYVARSANVLTTSTRFWVDLGAVRDARVVSIPRTNGSRNCLVRVRVFDVQDDTTTARADTGWLDLYPEIYPTDSLYWGHPSFYDGKMSDEDASLTPMPFVHVFGAPIIARYWLIEFDDTDNADGYIELPRIVIAPGWQASLNMAYGASLGLEDASVVQTSLGMAEFFDLRTKRRVVRFMFDYLPDDEALVWAADMQRRLGVSGQLMFIWDPDDTTHRHRRTFLARMRVLSPLEAAAFGCTKVTFELVEIVA